MPRGAVVIDVTVRKDDPVDIGKADADLPERFLQMTRGPADAGIEQRCLFAREQIGVYRPRLPAGERQNDLVDMRMDFFAAYCGFMLHVVPIVFIGYFFSGKNGRKPVLITWLTANVESFSDIFCLMLDMRYVPVQVKKIANVDKLLQNFRQ